MQFMFSEYKNVCDNTVYLWIFIEIFIKDLIKLWICVSHLCLYHINWIFAAYETKLP